MFLSAGTRKTGSTDKVGKCKQKAHISGFGKLKGMQQMDEGGEVGHQ